MIASAHTHRIKENAKARVIEFRVARDFYLSKAAGHPEFVAKYLEAKQAYEVELKRYNLAWENVL